MTVELAHPWALIILPLPLIIWFLVPPYRERISSVRVPFFTALTRITGQEAREGAVVLRRRWIQMTVALLIWLCLVAALAKPEVLGKPIERVEAGRDIMLAIDISGSMDKHDFAVAQGKPIQRLAAVKQVVTEFVEARTGDRIGFIVFGSKAYVQAPFTRDLQVVQELLNTVEAGMAGPHTVVGDAIGLAIRTFEASELKERLLILLTDGSDTGSRMSPVSAAGVAAQRNVEIFTVGVGDPEGGGEDQVDFDTLKEVARRTGGRFFSAADQQGLSAIYDRIDKLTVREVKRVSYRPRRSLVHWPSAFAVLLGIAFYLAQYRSWLRVRRQ